MKHLYIKFNAPTSDRTQTISKASGIFGKLIAGVASTFIPKANPDFDPLIYAVVGVLAKNFKCLEPFSPTTRTKFDTIKIQLHL